MTTFSFAGIFHSIGKGLVGAPIHPKTGKPVAPVNDPLHDGVTPHHHVIPRAPVYLTREKV